MDYTKDLEARLEQALTRWRGEKETFSAQDKAHKELTRQHALVLERCEAMKKEKKHMEDRLRQYEGLPLPVSTLLYSIYIYIYIINKFGRHMC